MSTNVYYNGVQLHNVVTREWDQEVVYDDSRTDVVMHRFKLRFEGLIHAITADETGAIQTPVWTAVGWGADRRFAIRSVAYQDIASALSMSRGVLMVTRVSADGTEEVFFRCVPVYENLNDPERDVDNGPKPLGFSILKIIGSSLLRVAFAVWKGSEGFDAARFAPRTT